jgi:hypothetical protein
MCPHATTASAAAPAPGGNDAGPALMEFITRVELPRPPRKKPITRHYRDNQGWVVRLELKGVTLKKDDFLLVGQLYRLEKLDLSETNVADEDLRQLAGLVTLRDLSLWHTAIDGSGFDRLGKLAKLERLNVGDAKFTNDALRHVKALTSLRYLELQRNEGVGDAGLAELVALKNLEALKLGETGVTDAGLAPLKLLPKLRSVTLDKTAVTAAGLAALAELPAFAWIASPKGAAEELVRRAERGDYQAVDEMLAVGLYFPGRGRFTETRLEAVAAGEKDRSPLVARFHIEAHWVYAPDKLDDTFYADFSVDRGAIFLSETGIREKGRTPPAEQKK